VRFVGVRITLRRIFPDGGSATVYSMGGLIFVDICFYYKNYDKITSMGNYEIDMERPTPAEEEEFAKRMETHSEAVKAVVEDLEAKYSDRKLKFTVPFRGSVPVQAWGYMDGYRFYFRFRRDIGSLRLGITNPEHYIKINDLRAKRETRQLAELEDGLKTGRLTQSEYADELEFFSLFRKTHDEKAPEFDDPMFYPTHIKKESVISEYTGERYEGTLDPGQMYDLFTKLVEKLEDCDIEL
jgi:hypothetical protein